MCGWRRRIIVESEIEVEGGFYTEIAEVAEGTEKRIEEERD
jgi:hypothetical protein